MAGRISWQVGNPNPCAAQPLAAIVGGIATSAVVSKGAGMPRRYPACSAAVTLLITAGGVIVALIALTKSPHVPTDYRDGLLALVTYAIPYTVTGAVLMVRRPDLPFGWLLAGTAAVSAVAVGAAASSYLAISHGASPGLGSAGFVLSGVGFVPVAVQGLVNVRFPSGRPTSRAGKMLEIALIVGIALGLLAAVIGAFHVDVARTDGTVIRVGNPLTDGTTVGRVAAGFGFVIPLTILLGLLAGLGVVRRAWAATGIERDQLQWRAFGVVLALALFPLAVTDVLPTTVAALDGVFFVATLVIPIVRYRLWAIDAIIRRSSSYALVTIVVAGGFAGIAAIGTVLAGERVGFVLAAAVAAVAFAPARAGAQRVVDRLFYGQRNDPYRALNELGRRLSGVAAPGEMLPSLVTVLAQSLRLPYVAIQRPGDGSVVAEHGDPCAIPSGNMKHWQLTYHGASVGVLVAAPRHGEDSFDARDRTVLADLARHAGAAVHAEALTADLRDSRHRLVTAREEERRRIRRDLHDGLGPLLTSIGLNLDAARARLASPAGTPIDPDELLAQAKAAATQAITDLRAIVYGLRPPALDDLGLLGAITTQTRRLSKGTALSVQVAADGLPELPAAIEVAAYRIVLEAVTNTVRHSDARGCHVRLHTDGAGLVVDITDDGRSTAPWSSGVGVVAMRERVAELGGTLSIGPTPDGGAVHARFPLSTTDGSARQQGNRQ